MSRPTLTTERLVLEPLTSEHLEDLVELDADPEVLRFIFGRGLTRTEVVETWLPRRTRVDADARGLGYWVGRRRDDGAFLGWWCLGVEDHPPDSSADAAELGYRLRRDAWGRGYATEGARALLGHAFDTVGVDRVWAETMAVNVASQRVMVNLGMTLSRSYVGEWDDPLPGAELGEVVYEIRRTAWLPLDSP